MIPCRVRARLSAPLIAHEPLHLDGLLMAAAARRAGLPPLLSQAQALAAEPIEIPVQLSACGRYYLCTAMQGETIARETKHVQRRFPLREMIALGDGKKRKINLAAGECKGFRSPHEARHIAEPTWYAVGDVEEIRGLLAWVTGLAKRRGVGHGSVLAWTVEPCEPWPGFPVLDRDGSALRHLPLDVDGLGDHVQRVGNTRPPYWLRPTERLIAAPVSRWA